MHALATAWGVVAGIGGLAAVLGFWLWVAGAQRLAARLRTRPAERVEAVPVEIRRPVRPLKAA